MSQKFKEGQPYSIIKKIYSVNIVYFGLGQGKDYVYEFKGEFVGLHYKDVLRPTWAQQEQFQVEKVSDILPKYYVLKVNNFNKVAEDPLDEWIYFLKNSEVKEGFKAKGLDKAKEKLRYEALSEIDKKIYDRSQENLRIEKNVKFTAELLAKRKIARNAIEKGLDNSLISELTGIPIEHIENMRHHPPDEDELDD